MLFCSNWTSHDPLGQLANSLSLAQRKRTIGVAEIKDFLSRIIQAQLTQEAGDWLNSQIENITGATKPLPFYFAFGGVPRFVSKDRLELSEEDLILAQNVRPGFDPGYWSVEQACRTILLLSLPSDQDFFFAAVENLFDTADMNEQAAILTSFAVTPFPERFVMRASEGIRTNMVPVFDAIALNNPYPADYLDTDPWNQMVLKAAFMDRPIYRIIGLQKRANADLAKIISDYAHERWAADRVVSPEFWRPVGQFANDAILSDMEKLLEQDETIQHDAACLVCNESTIAQAKQLLVGMDSQVERIKLGTLNWDTLAHDWWSRKSK